MTADQFEIYEDDQLVSVYESQQTILNPEVTASHYTLLLVDMSGSVSESEDKAQVVEAARLFTEKVETNNRVGIFAFDGEEKLHTIVGFTKLPRHADAHASSLASFKSRDNSTNLNGAVIAGLKELDTALAAADTPLRVGTLVVFTDGTDRASRVDAQTMLSAVQDSPHSVFAIGLGAEISEDDLTQIGKDGTTLATDRNTIAEAFEAIGTRIEALTRSYYLLSYCSPARAMEHEVRIEANFSDNNGNTQTAEEFTGSLSTTFSADGFKAGCNPNRAPKFDVSLGDRAGSDEDKTAMRNERRSSKKRKLSGKAKASVGTPK